MSMISSLIDELRKSADEWNGSNMFELARMCSEAADTIWQLRDDLQRANAAVQDAEHDESMAWDRVRKAEAENAKLRELVRDLHKALFTLDIDHCQACPRDNINGPCTKFMVCGSDECSIEEDMRELGIEVEDGTE